MEDIQQTDLVKSGETFIRVILRRTRMGMSVNVRTMAHIEEFFKTLGTGVTQDPVVGGRHWYPIGKDDVLKVYDITTGINFTMERKGVTANVNSVGVPIITYSDGLQQVNMGFLRLAGTSSPDGVTFGLKGIHSTESMSLMRDYIGEASKKLYINYMKPVNIQVMISSQGF